MDGVKLVISDAHTGLIAAIETVFQGSSWQRCRVHFMRNVLANVPKTAGPMVASIIRTIFAQPDPEPVYAQFRSEERRVGKECVSTCRSWWCPSHQKKNNKKKQTT